MGTTYRILVLDPDTRESIGPDDAPRDLDLEETFSSTVLEIPYDVWEVLGHLEGLPSYRPTAWLYEDSPVQVVTASGLREHILAAWDPPPAAYEVRAALAYLAELPPENPVAVAEV